MSVATLRRLRANPMLTAPPLALRRQGGVEVKRDHITTKRPKNLQPIGEFLWDSTDP